MGGENSNWSLANGWDRSDGKYGRNGNCEPLSKLNEEITMFELILVIVLFALLYGLTWHNQSARRRESGEGDSDRT